MRYEAVNAMLLNEFLKEHRTVQKQQKEIDALKGELKEQRALIQKVNDKMELNRPAPQTVLNNQSAVEPNEAALLFAISRHALVPRCAYAHTRESGPSNGIGLTSKSSSAASLFGESS
jgi:hypothetical protein